MERYLWWITKAACDKRTQTPPMCSAVGGIRGVVVLFICLQMNNCRNLWGKDLRRSDWFTFLIWGCKRLSLAFLSQIYIRQRRRKNSVYFFFWKGCEACKIELSSAKKQNVGATGRFSKLEVTLNLKLFRRVASATSGLVFLRTSACQVAEK